MQNLLLLFWHRFLSLWLFGIMPKVQSKLISIGSAGFRFHRNQHAQVGSVEVEQ